MTNVTILHNPRCSTSRHAMSAAKDGDVEVVDYLKRSGQFSRRCCTVWLG